MKPFLVIFNVIAHALDSKHGMQGSVQKQQGVPTGGASRNFMLK